MVDGSDGQEGAMEGPERLFWRDPELARIRVLLDRDAPPDGASERVLSAIGAPAGVLDGWRASSATMKLSLLAGAALLAIAASGIVLSARPAVPAGGEAPVMAAATSAAPATSALAAPKQAAPESESAPIVTVHVEDLPSAAPRGAAQSASAEDAFVLELALVERARAELARGRARECLDVARAYRRRFSNRGQFHEEIEVMRIEASSMTGGRAEARAEAARFLEQHGDTPYAERLRRVLARSAGER